MRSLDQNHWLSSVLKVGCDGHVAPGYVQVNATLHAVGEQLYYDHNNIFHFAKDRILDGEAEQVKLRGMLVGSRQQVYGRNLDGKSAQEQRTDPTEVCMGGLENSPPAHR